MKVIIKELSDGADRKLLLFMPMLQKPFFFFWPIITSDQDSAPTLSDEHSSKLCVKRYTSSPNCKNKLSLADNVP